MEKIINILNNIYNGMDDISIRTIERLLYEVSDMICELRYLKDNQKIDKELYELLNLIGVDIYGKTYNEIKLYILKLKHIAEFIELLK
jgi:hypothetical protein